MQAIQITRKKHVLAKAGKPICTPSEDEEARKEFLEELEKFPPEDRVYMDESGVDETLQRQYGRVPRGEEVPGENSGKKANRLSMIAARVNNTTIVPFRFEGYCDSLVRNVWTEECLLPA